MFGINSNEKFPRDHFNYTYVGLACNWSETDFTDWPRKMAAHFQYCRAYCGNVL